MIFFQKKTKNTLHFLILLFFLNACQKVDPNTGEKILIEPDPNKKGAPKAIKRELPSFLKFNQLGLKTK